MRTCRLLKLPAELRNRIYELALTTDGRDEIDLLVAVPPDRTPLLICREIHDEAKGIYKHAYRHFWTSTKFSLTADEDSAAEILRLIEQYRDEDLDHITHLAVSLDLQCTVPTGRTTIAVLDHTSEAAGRWSLKLTPVVPLLSTMMGKYRTLSSADEGQDMVVVEQRYEKEWEKLGRVGWQPAPMKAQLKYAMVLGEDSRNSPEKW
ncbi:hypothetical protein LTR85_005645 [Meristemomyces frigidus]|nr:hypothetical protein LTR85_005645 [Meristemomyces frigidus]